MTALWGCKAPGIGQIDPVDGGQMYRRCSVERTDSKGLCGPEGKLWSNTLHEEAD